MNKQKVIVLSILFFTAITSSAAVLAKDGYFDKKIENKVLAVEPIVVKPVAEVKQVAIAQKAPVKKAPVKKVTPKKKVVKKKKGVNLNPPVITPATAPYSAKKR